MTRARKMTRQGSVNGFYLMVLGALLALVLLGVVLYNLGKPTPQPTVSEPTGEAFNAQTDSDSSAGLFMYCAAGLRAPVEEIVADYKQEYGVDVQLQYGGSNTLLSQAEVSKIGDLYLAADTSYTDRAVEKGLVKETIPLAVMHLVIVVAKGNPKDIRGVEDLLRDDVRTALGNPDQAAIGNTTRELLVKSGQWEQLEKHVTDTGVFKPTVPEVANDVKLGSADAGIIWDTMLTLYPNLEAVHTAELDAGATEIAIGVMTSTETPTKALRFARYLTARDKGLVTFKEMGFEVVDGDVWAEVPEVTFFCGSVNRRAVDSVIKAFEQREGVVVNTVYNGCGILTAQMKTIRDQQQGGGFPDTYMACDRYYLENVKDWFQEDVDISDTEVVIAVQKGNPSNIQSLQDLTKPGVRVAVGQPDQCTIGALTRQVLEQEGVLDAVMKNVVTQTATSAMLVPTVTTNSVDAALAYATDTKAESDKVDSIRIGSPAAEAVQPFAIARSSDCKYLGRRLYQAIAQSRAQFENAGFHFRLDDATTQQTDAAEK